MLVRNGAVIEELRGLVNESKAIDSSEYDDPVLLHILALAYKRMADPVTRFNCSDTRATSMASRGTGRSPFLKRGAPIWIKAIQRSSKSA